MINWFLGNHEIPRMGEEKVKKKWGKIRTVMAKVVAKYYAKVVSSSTQTSTSNRKNPFDCRETIFFSFSFFEVHRAQTTNTLCVHGFARSAPASAKPSSSKYVCVNIGRKNGREGIGICLLWKYGYASYKSGTPKGLKTLGNLSDGKTKQTNETKSTRWIRRIGFTQGLTIITSLSTFLLIVSLSDARISPGRLPV